MNTYEVGLNPGGLLNSDNTVINQVISDINPNNYSLNIVRTNPVAFLPTSKPNVTSGSLGNGGNNSFIEVEKKERETAAEDWISALFRKKLEVKETALRS